jgi:hypothetical protein
MPVVWVPAQARYRDNTTGRFISRTTVLAYNRESIEAAGNQLKLLSARVKNSELSASEFTTLFRREVQDEFIRQYISGRGGLGSMAQSDWGRIGRALRDQYKFADGFIADIPTMSEAAIANRANMYAKAAGSAFEMGQRQASKISGKFKEEYWELGDAEHCDDCERLNSMGWVEIGTLPTVPRAGGTACLVNCECNIKYR